MFISRQSSQIQYSPLDEDQEEKCQYSLKSSFSSWKSNQAPARRFLSSKVIPWTISGILTAILICLMYEKYKSAQTRKSWGSYEDGFATDITSTKLHHVRFHSTFWVDDDDMWHISTNSSEPRYVGEPSPEMDEAWNDILYPRFMSLTTSEAEELGIRFTENDLSYGRIWVEPSGFHDLHCLNYLRQALDREYYPNISLARGIPEVPGKSSNRLHIDHCIELLRQSLTCHLDLTPIPRLWLVGNLVHANQDQVHTCRDFNAVKQWVVDHSEIPPGNWA